jgi:hypothetical protein
MVLVAVICLEYWNIGILECWESAFSIIPSFHYSEVLFIMQRALGLLTGGLRKPNVYLDKSRLHFVFTCFNG